MRVIIDYKKPVGVVGIPTPITRQDIGCVETIHENESYIDIKSGGAVLTIKKEEIKEMMIYEY